MRKGLTALAVVAVLLVGACGDDDSDEAGTDDTAATDSTGTTAADTGTSDTADTGSGSADGDYPPQARTNFVNACASQPGASEETCTCTFDALVETMPFEDFAAYEEALREDPNTPTPDVLIEAAMGCVNEAQP